MPRRISNSEVQTWLTCQNQYRYAFDMAIAPKRYSDALSRGILFHEVIAKYYLAIQDGASADQALTEARKVLSKALATNSDAYSMEVVTQCDSLIRMYSAYYGTDPKWEVLEVETSYDLPITDEFTMPMRLDLLVRDRETLQTLLVDTKTCYNFFSSTKIALYGQFPKYTGALRFNGRMVNGVLINMVRTRPDAKEVFKRQKVEPSTAKVRRVLHEHILASEEIVAYRSKPDEVRPIIAKRVLNDAVCKMCSYQSLCMSELDGGNIDYEVATDFQPNPYNYNETVSNELGML